MEVLSAAHNIVSAAPEQLSEKNRGCKGIYYLDNRDMIVIAGWDEDAGMIGKMIADYLELSQEGKQSAEEFCLSSGNDCVIRLNDTLKEIARLRREKRTVTMRIDEIRIYPCFAVHPPKPGKVERKEWQYAESGVETLLKKIRKRQLENKLTLGQTWKEEKGLENLVFTYEGGGTLWDTGIRVDIRKIIDKIHASDIAFELITPHTFRHTFATRGLEQGIPLKIMQSILGHSSLAMTSDLYSHVLPNTKAEEMKKLEKVL